MSAQIAQRIRNLIVLLCLVAPLTSNAATTGGDQVPPNVREAIETVMKERVAELLKEKDAEGVQIKRGVYSRTFKKIDDTTYEVGFSQNTVQKSTIDRDQMKVDRYVLTVKQTGGKWAITDQKLADSYDQLFRAYFGGGLRRFDRFTFEKEGVKVSATNGVLYSYTRKGEPIGFRLVADDLTYSYKPPVDAGFYGSATSHGGIVMQELSKKNPEDIVFKPMWLRTFCDPDTCKQIYDTAFQGIASPPAAGGAGTQPEGRGGTDSKLRGIYDEELKDSKKSERENPFGGFFPERDPEQRAWSLTFKRDSAKEHYFYMGYDNFEPREINVAASSYGTLFRYNSEDVRKSKITPYDLEARPDSDARDYDLRGIEGSVDVALENPEQLDGDITYTMYMKRELDRLPFNISRVRFPGGSDKETKNPKLFVNSIRDGDGNELTWVKLSAFTGLVFFPKPVAADSEFKLRMQFTNLDSIYNLNPSYSWMDRGGWLPFVRFADMIDKFDLTVRSPAKFQVLGVGGKLGDAVKDGVRTTRWSSKSPVSFPTIIFGDYITDKSTHPAKKLDGSPIPVNVWVDRVSTTSLDSAEAAASGSRDIRPKQLSAIAIQAAVALELYKKVYAVDYPFDKLDLVADPLGSFYGQAPASIIYLGFGVFRGEGEVAVGFGGGANISKFNKDVVAHETAHQWWGSLICNANQGNYWFVESLAELSSALYVDEVFGRKKYLQKIDEWRRNVLEANPVASVQDNYTVYAGEGGAPQANIYNKGPYAFHILRTTFGDVKFFEFLKELATSLKGKEIVTRDIQDVAEKVYGGNMEWFFDQWIRGIGMPQYAMNYTARKTEDGKWLVEGTIKQRVVFGKDKTEIPGKFYRAVAPLTFIAHNGNKFRSKPLLVEGAVTPFKMKIADEPAEVRFNDEGEILAQDVLVNRSW